MRAALPVLLFLASLTLQSTSAAPQQPPAAKSEVLAADTPRTTVEGNKFIAPAGWRIEVRGPATILAAPEGDSHIALVDVKAKDADTAVAAAWAAYRPEAAKWPLKVTNDYPDKDGWSEHPRLQLSDLPEREARRLGERTSKRRHVDGRDLRHGSGRRREALVHRSR